MTKTYVIDTNVLVHDYHSFKKILNSDNKVVIPYVVLEELDKLKTKLDQVGVNARKVIKEIELELIANNPNVSVVQTDGDELADDKIIKACEKLNETNECLILVSKDVCLRTKARSKELVVEDYKSDKVQLDKLYSGKREVYVSSDIVTEVYDKKETEAQEVYYPNECIVLIDSSNPKTKAITIHKNGKLLLMDNKVKPFDLECKNLEQQIAVNFLLDPQIQLVTITGGAGGGKTLIAIASALESILEREEYNKLLVARPIMPFQKDVGYLPGSIEEKMIHWFGPVMDNLDFLISFAEQPYYKKQAKMTPFEYLQEKGVIDILPLTYIRGRSIANSYIIIDECLAEDQIVYVENKGKMKIKEVEKVLENERVFILSKNLDENINEYKELESIKVEDFQLSKEKMYEIELEDGTFLKVTGNHKLMINGKYQTILDVMHSDEELELMGL